MYATEAEPELPHFPVPSLEQLRDTALPHARLANPACQVTGISVNTKALDEAAAKACLQEIEDRMGLPATDPYRFGAAKLVDSLSAL